MTTSTYCYMLANEIKYDLIHTHHWDTILTLFCSNISIPLEDAKNSFLHLTDRGLRLTKVHVQDGGFWVERMNLKLMSELLRCATQSVPPAPLLTIVTNSPRLAVLCLDLVIHKFDSYCWPESFSWLQKWQKKIITIL